MISDNPPSDTPPSDTLSSGSGDNLSKFSLSAGSPLTESILDNLCRQWGKPAVAQLLQDLHGKFQADPLLAGRYGARNIQVLLEELET